jgi:hypothetical protein
MIIGLYPFNFITPNNVRKAGEGRALLFNAGDISDKYNPRGIVFTPPELKLGSGSDTVFFTIDFTVRCRQVTETNLNAIMTISKNKVEKIIFEQWQDALIIRSSYGKVNNIRFRQIGLDHALPEDSLQTIIASFTQSGTYLYVNNKLKQHYPEYFIIFNSSADFLQATFGNSISGDNPWHGEIFQVAVYKNHTCHSVAIMPDPSAPFSTRANRKPAYHFDFTRPDGLRLSDDIRYQDMLVIPEHFKILKKNYITWRWEYRTWNRVLLTDIILNFIGFMPLGLLVVFNLRYIKWWSVFRIISAAVLVSFTISFIIEMLQASLISRDSSAFDLILNTCGGLTGAAFGLILIRIKATSDRLSGS